MTESEWNLFVHNLKIGHDHATNADYLHELKSRIYLRYPHADITETVMGHNKRIVHALMVKCEGQQAGFIVELPLSGKWERKA